MATNNKLLNCPPLRFPEFNDEWEQTTFGKVLVFETGYPFSSDGFNEEGDGIRLVKNRDLKSDDRCIFYSEDYDEQYIVQDGDVLIGMDGDFSPCLWKKGIALLNQRVGRIKVKGEVSSILLYHLLGKYLKEIELKTASTTVKHLSHKDIENIKAFLPVPDEQRKIAAFLSLLEERIEAQRQTIKERKKQKKALLHQLFSQSLRFPEFSDKWTQTTLGEVVDIQRGERMTKSDLVENGVYPVVSGGKEPMGYLNKYNQDGFTTTIAQYGTAGYIQWQRKPFWANDVCYILKPNSSYLIPVYLYNLISAKQLDIYRLVNTTAVPAHLPKERLLSLTIPLPSLAEQKRIAELFTTFDERIEVEEALLKCYETQKRYLLRQMFV